MTMLIFILLTVLLLGYVSGDSNHDSMPDCLRSYATYGKFLSTVAASIDEDIFTITYDKYTVELFNALSRDDLNLLIAYHNCIRLHKSSLFTDRQGFQVHDITNDIDTTASYIHNSLLSRINQGLKEAHGSEFNLEKFTTRCTFIHRKADHPKQRDSPSDTSDQTSHAFKTKQFVVYPVSRSRHLQEMKADDVFIQYIQRSEGVYLTAVVSLSDRVEYDGNTLLVDKSSTFEIYPPLNCAVNDTMCRRFYRYDPSKYSPVASKVARYSLDLGNVMLIYGTGYGFTPIESGSFAAFIVEHFIKFQHMNIDGSTSNHSKSEGNIC